MGVSGMTMKRTRVLGGATTLALALPLFLAAGCSAPADPEEARPEKYVEPVAISQAATDAYGEGAKEAYTEIAELVMKQSLQAPFLDPQRTSFTRDQLSAGIVSHMVPSTQTVWYGYVDKALAGDQESQEIVDLLRVYNMAAPQLTMPPEDEVVTNQAISNAKVDIAQTTTSLSDKPLQISFDHSARLQYLHGRAHYRSTVDRALSFVVVPASSATGTASATDTASSTGAGETTASASSTASAATPSAATSSAAATTAPDPAAKWLITHFDGTTTFSFDDAGDSPTGLPTDSTETADSAETADATTDSTSSDAATEPASTPSSSQ